ncbi:MAG TPA: hypothetical protein VGH79_02560 [Gaiellaceae bacterium]
MAERLSMLVTVKAYPAISQKYHEAVCVAGVRTDTPEPQWVRLYPVQYRDLPWAQRFKKYQEISFSAEKHSSDRRPETYRPDVDTLELGGILDSKRDWAKRRPYVEPLVVESMCAALRMQETDGTSLAAFRPAAVEDFLIDDDVEAWSEGKAAAAAQPSLFFPTKDGLEQIPFRFRYRYRCATEGCRGHTQSMIDWELAQSYRPWRELYDEPTLLENLRKRFLEQMCGPDKDTIFFVGNQHQYPKGFLVLGVFWPKRSG